MAFASVIRTLARSRLTQELCQNLVNNHNLKLTGIPRLPKGLIASAFAQQSLNKAETSHLFVICATLEEAGRWATQLQSMDWETVQFYPTSEATPYEPFNPESEMIWGQIQVLLTLQQQPEKPTAIVATEKSLQPHLPPQAIFSKTCLSFEKGMSLDSKTIDHRLTELGYERVSLVETEGQWTRRGDLVDIFPVASELPIRLEWFGDELEQLREFDPVSQRSLDQIESLTLTPTNFSPLIAKGISEQGNLDRFYSYLSEEEQSAFEEENYPDGMHRFLGLAYPEPASLLDYLPENTLVVVDEPEQCQAHSDRALEHTEDQYQEINPDLPRLHADFKTCLEKAELFYQLHFSEITEENDSGVNLASRPLPVTPHQFAKLAEIVRGKREIYS
ncbi:MAG: transcription-repair coupling factor, partial [Halothece sp. Uz-M2-17]|nr:transcription-repair coupling factor [Halothece sp. Uz-M2-17]